MERTSSVAITQLHCGGGISDQSVIEHPNIVCDGCESFPLHGTRYRCLHCSNFDLCSACWQLRMAHPPSHQFLVVPAARAELPQLTVRDGSLLTNNNETTTKSTQDEKKKKEESTPEEGGDFDLSSATAAISTAEHLHVRCDSCHQEPIVGIRYKCVFCDDYDLCSQCFQQAGEVAFHSSDHLFSEIRAPLDPTGPPLAFIFRRPETGSRGVKMSSTIKESKYFASLACKVIEIHNNNNGETSSPPIRFSLHPKREGAIIASVPVFVENPTVTIRLGKDAANLGWHKRCKIILFLVDEEKKKQEKRIGGLIGGGAGARNKKNDGNEDESAWKRAGTITMSDQDSITLAFPPSMFQNEFGNSNKSKTSSSPATHLISIGATISIDNEILVHEEYPNSKIPISNLTSDKYTSQSSFIASNSSSNKQQKEEGGGGVKRIVGGLLKSVGMKGGGGKEDDKENDYLCMMPTCVEYEPWWQVDLLDLFAIDRIIIHAPQHKNSVLSVCCYVHVPAAGKDIQGHHFLVNIDADGNPVESTVRVMARFIRVTLPQTTASLALNYVGALGANLFNRNNMPMTILDSFHFFRRKNLFGVRKWISPEKEGGELENEFSWVTYKQAWQRIRAFSAGLVTLDIFDTASKNDGRCYVGIAARNCPEWVISDVSCLLLSLVTCPIASTADLTSSGHILNIAEVGTLIAADSFAKKYWREFETMCPNLKNIVLIDDRGGQLNGFESAVQKDDAKLEWRKESKRIRIFTMQEIEEIGVKSSNMSSFFRPSPPSALCTVVFTSGSTGLPKGVMRSYHAYAGLFEGVKMAQPMVHISFQPLSHEGEREMMTHVMLAGGQAGFASGDISLLFKDCSILRPSIFGAVPRVFNLMFSLYHELLAEEKKKRGGDDIGQAALKTAEREAMGRIRSIMGNRMQSICIGSAPSSPAVVDFFKDCFGDCGFCEAYGSTEVGTIAADYYVTSDVEVQLIDIPELGYSPIGNPRMGEVLVRSKTMFEGYFRDDAATKKAIDSEGWFHTGDIGKLIEGDRLVVVGRKTNTFKLAQGEFVSPESIEGVYGQTAIVEQIHVHGTSTESTLVAVVIPNESLLRSSIAESSFPLFASNKDQLLSLDFRSLLKRPEICQFVRSLLCGVGHEKGLRPYELVSAVYLESERFTMENGLLTNTMKPNRISVEKKYKDIFAQLYANSGGAPAVALPIETPSSIEKKSDNNNNNDNSSSSSSSSPEWLASEVSDLVSGVMGAAVGANSDLAAQLGQDSLAAVRISSLAKSRLGKEIPMWVWFSASTVGDIFQYLQGGNSAGSGFNSQIESMRADMALPLPIKVLSGLIGGGGGGGEEKGEMQNVFLTGVTGFLGIFLLERLLSSTRANVFCLVRAGSDSSALHRILAKLSWAKVDLQDGWLDRIIPVAGNLSAPLLGLTPATFESLARVMDSVIHCGAAVNWRMIYEQLRKPNVGGVVEIIRFCGLGKKKRLNYISTISTVGGSGLEASSMSTEEALQSQPYCASKWVAERLVQRAGKMGLPITIIRPAMIANHSTTGVGNITDFNCRFLATCLDLKISLAHGADSAQLFDMTPVDFVAAAVVAIAQDRSADGKTFHIENLRGSPTHKQIAAGISKLFEKVGDSCQELDYASFRSIIHNAKQPHSLSPLLEFFPPSGLGTVMGPWNTNNTDKVLKSAGIVCPVVSAEMINVALEWVKQEPHAIPPASNAAAVTRVVSDDGKKNETSSNNDTSSGNNNVNEERGDISRTVSIATANFLSRAASTPVAVEEEDKARRQEEQRIQMNFKLKALIEEKLQENPAADLTEVIRNYLSAATPK